MIGRLLALQSLGELGEVLVIVVEAGAAWVRLEFTTGQNVLGIGDMYAFGLLT